VTGVVTCSSGKPTCLEGSLLADGTSCGNQNVCIMGSCVPQLTFAGNTLTSTTLAIDGSLAGLTDVLTAEMSDAFSATVDWGDGTTSPGTVTGSAGMFTVSGSHTFSTLGTYTGKVTVTDASTGASAGGAVLVTAGVTTYAVPGLDLPLGGSIVTGPDGNLWFTAPGTNAIGRITPAGDITTFPIPTDSSGPAGITAGADGNLWFTESYGNQIGRITPDGQITEMPIPTASASPIGITAGPDGNVWFTEGSGNQIGQVTSSGINEFPIPSTNVDPAVIVAGPDGNLWFTEQSAAAVASITPAGVIAQYPVPGSYPSDIVAGPDDNLWFTDSSWNKLARLTTSAMVTQFPIDNVFATLAVGPDGNIWFAPGANAYAPLENNLGRMTMTGATTMFSLPFVVEALTAGPDGNLWMLEPDGIAVITPP